MISVLFLGPRGAVRVGIVLDRLRSTLALESGESDVPSVGVRMPPRQSSAGEGSWGDLPPMGERPSSASGLIMLFCRRGICDGAGPDTAGRAGRAPNVDIGRGGAPPAEARRFMAGWLGSPERRLMDL